MIVTSIESFKEEWKAESDKTRKIFAALTDESLNQSVADDHRTIGRMAWHIVQCISEMGCRTGLEVKGPDEKAPVPNSAETIQQEYNRSAQSLLDQLENWKDDDLHVEDDMYGQQWKRGMTLNIILKHELHHRAQMTVLMRQAGLKVPGIYGPSKDEWGQYNAPPPEV